MDDKRSKVEEAKPKPAALRLFVAISLPEDVKDQIEKAQRELRDALPGSFVRWTKREQLHLTLKFLGSVTESRVDELTSALRIACLNFAGLRLRAEGIGFFPDVRFPRVIWVSVRDDRKFLPRLQLAIDTGLARFTNEKSEKEFTGHVTLGRIQKIRRPEAEVLVKL